MEILKCVENEIKDVWKVKQATEIEEIKENGVQLILAALIFNYGVESTVKSILERFSVDLPKNMIKSLRSSDNKRKRKANFEKENKEKINRNQRRRKSERTIIEKNYKKNNKHSYTISDNTILTADVINKLRGEKLKEYCKKYGITGKTAKEKRKKLKEKVCKELTVLEFEETEKIINAAFINNLKGERLKNFCKENGLKLSNKKVAVLREELISKLCSEQNLNTQLETQINNLDSQNFN